MKKLGTFDLLGLAALCAAILVAIGYGSTLHYPFFFDDYPDLVNNELIRSFRHIGEVFWYSPVRIFNHVSFMLNYQLSGYNVMSYHLVNIGIHVINSALVGWLAFQLLSLNQKNATDKERFLLISIFVGFLFLVHPIQIQAVTYLSQRVASLATLFYLLSANCYCKTLDKKTNSRAWYIGALIAAIAGMFTKQNVFTLPLFIVLIDGFATPAKKWNISQTLKRTWPLLLTMAIIPLFLILVPDVSVKKFAEHGGRTIALPGTYFLTQQQVLLKYIQLLIFPWRQSLSYDITPATLANVTTWVCLLANAAIFFFGLFAWHQRRLLGLGIVFFYLALSVESTFMPLEDFIFEHRIYLASAGFFLVLADLLNTVWLRQKKSLSILTKNTAATVVGAFLVCLPIAILTNCRNDVWGSELSLWKNAVENAPNNPRAIFNLADAYIANKVPLAESKTVIVRATQLNQKRSPQQNLVLGSYLLAGDEVDLALPILEEAFQGAKSDPRVIGVYLTALKKAGRFSEVDALISQITNEEPTGAAPIIAVSEFYLVNQNLTRALDVLAVSLEKPEDRAALLLQKSKVLLHKQKFNDANTLVNDAIAIHPSKEAYTQMAIVANKLDRFEDVVAALEKAVTFPDSGDFETMNLVDAYEKKGDANKALALLNSLVTKQPDSYRLRWNIAVFLLNHRAYSEAITAGQTAIELCGQCRDLSELYVFMGKVYEAVGDNPQASYYSIKAQETAAKNAL